MLTPARAKKLKKLKTDIKLDRQLYIMMIPALVWFIVFQFYPMYFLQIAFKDYKPFLGIGKSEWVGFKQFEIFFNSPYFLRTLKNTVMINIYSLCINFPSALILALLYNEVKNRIFVKVSQTIAYMPHFISAVVVAGMMITFLSPSSGIVNQIITKLGGEPIYFLADAKYFRIIYTLMNLWHGVGFSSIIFIAALHAVDQELYEAATIDGAGKMGQVLHVTIPGILPTIIIQLILAIGNMLSVGYETIILLYQPSTYETADVISTYVYRSGLQEGNYSFATAVSIFNSVVAIILVAAVNKLSKKVSETSLW